jgi:hypothetical protein
MSLRANKGAASLRVTTSAWLTWISQIRFALAAICAASLIACFAVKKLPPPKATGSALALPAVANTMPVFVFVKSDGGNFSVERQKISGIAVGGKEFRALSTDDAADTAGGPDQLLARLSDEGEVEHVAKSSGAILGKFALGGLDMATSPQCFSGGGPYAGAGVLVCAAAGAVVVAAGLVTAVGVGTYLGVNRHARQIGMLEDVALPDDDAGNPLKGYVFLPAAKYQTLRIPLTYPALYESQVIEVPVAPGTPPSPAILNPAHPTAPTPPPGPQAP